MAKPKKVIRSIQKNIAIPEDLAARMDLHLYSDVEGRIPFGKTSEFISQLLRDYFNGLSQGVHIGSDNGNAGTE